MEKTEFPCKELQSCYCQLLGMLVRLMHNPTSPEALNRHFALLNEFFEVFPHGFWMKDLPYIIRLIRLMSVKLEELAILPSHFKKILQLCRAPPMLTRSSEVLEYEQDLQEYFSTFGYLLASLKDLEQQGLVFQALESLLTRNTPIANYYVSLEVCKDAVEKSQLPEVVADLLGLTENYYYKRLLELTELLIEGSDTICQIMAKANVLNTLIVRLMPEGDKMPEARSLLEMTEGKFRRTDILDVTLNIILPMLDACRRGDDDFKRQLAPPSYTAWKWMHYVFRMLSMDELAKSQRNAVLIIIIQCVEIFNIIPVVDILPDDVAILCSAAVGEAHGTWAANIRFTTDEYDFRFLQMILLLLCYHVKCPDSFKYFLKRESLARILLLINTKIQLIWTHKQRCTLILQSLQVLTVIAPVVINQFVLYDGPLRLLNLCKIYMTEGFYEDVLYAALRCMFATVQVKDVAAICKYREKFGIDVLLGLIDYLLRKEILTMEIQEAVTNAFAVLQLLNKEYYYSNQKVVVICLPHMKRCFHPNAGDMVQNPRLLIAMLDFLWENFSWSSSNLSYFVTEGGIYYLLDIIEKCCFPVKVIALGMLVDLCEEGSCIPYLLTWRGKKTTLIPMLLKLFRFEENNLGVKRTNRGVIADIELPLMGKLQRKMTFAEEKDGDSSPSTLDLLGSARPKIYSILHLLTCRHKDKVEAVNNIYKISSNQYSIDDQITKLIAENYLPLKLGEVWVELKRDLDRVSIKPLAFNQQLFSTLMQRFYRWSLHIKTVQEELLKQEKFQERVNEHLLYEMLRETRLASSLQAMRELRYTARCTETLFRLMAKMKQTDQVKASMNVDVSLGKFHPTFNAAVKVTAVFNQKLDIQSNVFIDLKEEPFDLEPVSPSGSGSQFD